MTFANQFSLNVADDNFEIGQIVLASFTNSGRVRKFIGQVIRRTKNDWKIKAFTSPMKTRPLGASSVWQL